MHIAELRQGLLQEPHAIDLSMLTAPSSNLSAIFRKVTLLNSSCL
jgi:hypothetical protein